MDEAAVMRRMREALTGEPGEGPSTPRAGATLAELAQLVTSHLLAVRVMLEGAAQELRNAHAVLDAAGVAPGPLAERVREALRERHERPVPAGGEGDAWQVVIDALPEGAWREACAARRALGVARYGQPLALRGDGLDSMALLLPEVLDVLVYATRVACDSTCSPEERAAARETLDGAADHALLLLGADPQRWAERRTVVGRLMRAVEGAAMGLGLNADGSRWDGPVARSRRGVGW